MCGEGGSLYGCDFCIESFCKQCILRNLGRTAVTEIEASSKWKCYICDPSKFDAPRALADKVYESSKLHEKYLETKQLKRNGFQLFGIRDQFWELYLSREITFQNYAVFFENPVVFITEKFLQKEAMKSEKRKLEKFEKQKNEDKSGDSTDPEDMESKIFKLLTSLENVVNEADRSIEKKRRFWKIVRFNSFFITFKNYSDKEKSAKILTTQDQSTTYNRRNGGQKAR